MKEHSSKAGDLEESQRWTKVMVQRKRSYGEVPGRSRYREETTSKDSDKEEKEVSKVDRDQVWPGTSGKANRRSERELQGDDIVMGTHFEGELDIGTGTEEYLGAGGRRQEPGAGQRRTGHELRGRDRRGT